VVDGSPVEIDTTTRHDTDDHSLGLRLRLGAGAGRSFTVRIRVPEWAGSATVLVNGSLAVHADTPGRAAVSRHWSAGDVVEIRLPTPLRIVRGQTIGRHLTDERAVAVFYGPRLFCLTERLNPEHRLDLLRLALPGSDPEDSVQVVAPDRLQIPGLGPDSVPRTLELWPLSHTGGSPNGIGRTHPTKANYFKAWIPNGTAPAHAVGPDRS